MNLASELRHEWGELCDEPLIDQPHATRADWLAAVRADPDSGLLDLVRRAQDGCGVAGRIIVQALLPALIKMAGRDRAAELGDYVSHLWLVMHGYPVARRPLKVAANLVLDTRKSVCRDRPSPPPDTVAPEHVVEPWWDGAMMVERACSMRLITAETASVLRSVYVEGTPTVVAAQRHGLSHAALRQRCSKATRRLAHHRLALVA